jgi:hypothetical protein
MNHGEEEGLFNKRKIGGLLTLIPAFCLISTSAWASSWSPKTDIDLHKTWNISFAKPLKESTVNQNNIYVITPDNQHANVNVYVKNSSTVLVDAPVTSGYTQGKTYTLHIDKNVETASGVKMNDSIDMPFTVKAASVISGGGGGSSASSTPSNPSPVAEQNIQSKILGKWHTSYKGLDFGFEFQQGSQVIGTVLGTTNPGTYSINGSQITMSIASYNASGMISFNSDSQFTITNGSKVMTFNKQ